MIITSKNLTILKANTTGTNIYITDIIYSLGFGSIGIRYGYKEKIKSNIIIGLNPIFLDIYVYDKFLAITGNKVNATYFNISY